MQYTVYSVLLHQGFEGKTIFIPCMWLTWGRIDNRTNRSQMNDYNNELIEDTSESLCSGSLSNLVAHNNATGVTLGGKPCMHYIIDVIVLACHLCWTLSDSLWWVLLLWAVGGRGAVGTRPTPASCEQRSIKIAQLHLPLLKIMMCNDSVGSNSVVRVK